MKSRIMKKTLSFVLLLAMMLSLVPAFTFPAAAEDAVWRPAGWVTPFEKHGRLQINDAKLSDSEGDSVVIRGMSTHGLQWDTSEWMDDKLNEVYNALAYDWQMDIIRLAMYVGENGYALSPRQMLDRLEAHIQMATRYGLYVLVDWHVHAPGNPTAPIYLNAGMSATDMPEEFNAIKAANPTWNGPQVFFAYIAQKYGAQGNILYEPANEPSTNATDGPGLPSNQASWDNVLKPYFDSVVQAIRVYDELGIVMCGSPAWTQNPQFAITNPVADPDNETPQIMYTVHFYTGTHNFNTFMTNIDNCMDAGLAIFASEWGVSNADGNGGPFLFVNPAGVGTARSAQIWLNALEERGIGWAAWSLGRKNENSATFFEGTTLPLVRGENGIYSWPSFLIQPAGHYYRWRTRAIDGEPMAQVRDTILVSDLRTHFFNLDPDSVNRDITMVRERIAGNMTAKFSGVSSAGTANNIVTIGKPDMPVNVVFGSFPNLTVDVYLPAARVNAGSDAAALSIKPVMIFPTSTDSSREELAVPMSAFIPVTGTDLVKANIEWPLAANTARIQRFQFQLSLTAETAGADVYIGTPEFYALYTGDVANRPAAPAERAANASGMGTFPTGGATLGSIPYTFTNGTAPNLQGWQADHEGAHISYNKDIRVVNIGDDENPNHALMFPVFFSPGENEEEHQYRIKTPHATGGTNLFNFPTTATRAAFFAARRAVTLEIYVEKGKATTGDLSIRLAASPNGGHWWVERFEDYRIDPTKGELVIGHGGRELLKHKIVVPYTFAAEGNSDGTVFYRNLVLFIGNADSDYEGLLYIDNIGWLDQAEYDLWLIDNPIEVPYDGCHKEFTWSINDPRDVTVTQIGTGDHVLKLDNFPLPAEAIAAATNATITINYGPQGNNSNRRICMWTDLSGTEEAVSDITFLTAANRVAGRWLRTPNPRIEAGDMSAFITENLKSLLYTEAAGKANTIYLALTTDQPLNNTDNTHTLASNQRGGGSNNEYVRFDNIVITLTGVDCECEDCNPDLPPDDGCKRVFEWSINDPRDASVTQLGNLDHLLKLDNLGISAEALAASTSAALEIQYRTGQTVGSSRRINAWTDLSGTAEAVSDISFMTGTNRTANRFVRTDPRLESADTSGRIAIPKALLFDAAAGKANTVFVAITTDANLTTDPNAYTLPGNNRGAAEFARLDTIRLVLEGIDCNCEDCDPEEPPPFQVHLFPVPIEKVPGQDWGANQKGWNESQFDSPTGLTSSGDKRAERRNADLRYLVMEFSQPPGMAWSLRFQNSEPPAWRVSSGPSFTAANTALQYVIDFEGGVTIAAGNPPHPGFTKNSLYVDFQLLFNLTGTGASWDTFVSRISRAYLTNVHPDDVKDVEEVPVASWASVAGGTAVTANATAHNDLKLYYSYTSNGVAAMRLQYSIDGGTTWVNMPAPFNTSGAAASGSRTEFLPEETHNKNVQFRWIPHGIFGNNDFGAASFTATNVRLVSGLQHGERAGSHSNVIAIGAAPANLALTQRDVHTIEGVPSVLLHSAAPAGTSAGVQWTSTNTNVATVADGVIRALGGGTTTIRVAAVADTSIYVEFNVTVTAAVANPNINFKITNPYAHVNWDTFGQYKTAHHTHTTNSDGNAPLDSTAERFYTMGFNVASFTDHNVVTPTPDRSGVGPMTLARIAEMRAGAGRNGAPGMIFIPESNELSGLGLPGITQNPTGHHVNVYWAGNMNSGGTIRQALNRLDTDFGGGLARLNHPGRYTGSLHPTPWVQAEAIANDPANYMVYVNDVFRPSHSMIGMELINKFDTESQADRVLWDNILSVLMPEGRPVWGFSDDDSHSNNAIGFSYNLLLMPELNLSEVRYAMESGAFLAFTRVDRQYRIFTTPITANDWDGTGVNRTAAHNQPVPEVKRITVGNNSITVDAEITVSGTTHVIDNDTTRFIDWVADGVVIHRGKTLDLRAHQLSIYSYVRATIVTPTGVIYTQPFGIEEIGNERELPNLMGINNGLDEIVIDQLGVAKCEMGLGLPPATRINTDEPAGSLPRFGAIIWDLDSANYDPTLDTKQTFTVNGVVRLQRGITNTNDVDLKVSVQVTVQAPPVRETIEISAFGDRYHYFGRTNPEFMTEAFDMTTLTGWTEAVTPIGFATNWTFGGTQIPTGSGPNQRGIHPQPTGGNGWHTFTYFKKSFELDLDLNKITGIIGRHQIDDTLFLFINGVEVYRFNGVPANQFGPADAEGNINAAIGSSVDWGAYSGRNMNPRVLNFDIKSNYGPDGLIETNTGAIAGEDNDLYHSASLTNLKAALKPGTNVITAVVGNNSSTSSDLMFNLEMFIEYDPVEDDECECVPGEKVDIFAATCTLAGVWEIRCLECEELIEAGMTPATGHTSGAQVTTLAPTCIDEGAWEIKCTVCEEVLQTGIITALGHTPGAAETCTTAQICTVCEIELAPALGHAPGEAATCTTAQICTRCEIELAPALGHTPGDSFVALDPVCLEEGRWEIRCEVCDDLLEYGSIDALGHDYGGFLIDEEDDTYQYRVCERCEDVEITDRPLWAILSDRAPSILRYGLGTGNLHLSANNKATLTLVLPGIDTERYGDIILSTNANNRNVEGLIDLGDGYFLRFDIKGNGSNIKVFEVIFIEKE